MEETAKGETEQMGNDKSEGLDRMEYLLHRQLRPATKLFRSGSRLPQILTEHLEGSRENCIIMENIWYSICGGPKIKALRWTYWALQWKYTRLYKKLDFINSPRPTSPNLWGTQPFFRSLLMCGVER